MAEGVWRTINGARVFIGEGQTLNVAMANAGFETGPNGTPEKDVVSVELSEIEGRKGGDKFIECVNQYIQGDLGRDSLKTGDVPRTINSFIDKNQDLHYEGGTLYRGMSMEPDEIENIINGKKDITMDGISSWTPDAEVGDGFAESASVERTGDLVTFVERSAGKRNAISVDSIAEKYQGLGWQKEVIYSGKQKFTYISHDVKDVKFKGMLEGQVLEKKHYTIYVKEKQII